MAKKKKKSPRPKSHATTKSTPKRGRRYTPGEWFMVILGSMLVVLFIGIVLTAVLGGD